MRTTLDIDPTVLAAARALAAQENLSLGAAVSRLALRGLRPVPVPRRAGFPVLTPTDPDRIITDELVAQHRDDD
ncbi:MAG: antitoxin [Micrococcales bacterium]|nr:antitoxin [Micrococcales bacterium]